MITYENYKRMVILSEITGKQLSGNFKMIKDMIDKHLTDIQIFVNDKYPYSEFYGKDENSIVLEMRNDILQCDYANIYCFLWKKIKFEHDDFINFMMGLVEDGLKLKPQTISTGLTSQFLRIEDGLKLKPQKILSTCDHMIVPVEDRLKLKPKNY